MKKLLINLIIICAFIFTSQMAIATPISQGWQALKTHNTKKAYDYFYDYHQQHPNNIEALRGLGATFYAAGDTLRAAPYFLAVLRLSPSDIDARRRLTQIYFYRENYSGAIRVNKGILKYRPNDKAALLNVAYANTLRGKYRTNIAQYQHYQKR